MQLILMRHGEAETFASSDKDRKLTALGKSNNVYVVNEFLKRKPEISVLLCSQYRRAQQTTQSVLEFFPEMETRYTELLIPESHADDVVNYLDHLVSVEKIQSLMLVGHNPLLTKLLCVLIEGNANGSHHIDTSNLVCLEFDILAPATADIKYWISPLS